MMAMPIAIKNVDELGRFVIPAQARELLKIGSYDPLEVFVEEDQIIIRKRENKAELRNSIHNILSAVEKRKQDLGADKVLDIESVLYLIEKEIMKG